MIAIRFQPGLGPGATTDRVGGVLVVSTPAPIYQRITAGVFAGRVGVLQPDHPAKPRRPLGPYVVELSIGPVHIPREDLAPATRAEYERDRDAHPAQAASLPGPEEIDARLAAGRRMAGALVAVAMGGP